MSPLDLLYRGHPNLVMLELEWLKWVRSQGSVIAGKICMWITSRVGVSEEINFKMLIQDPLALNWERPQQAIN